jgi:addiction module HigA family antidote
MREIIEERALLSVAAAAEAMHVTRQSLNDVPRGKTGVTAEMAERFEKVFGGSADLWLHMQIRCDRYAAREKLVDVLPKLRRITCQTAA